MKQAHFTLQGKGGVGKSLVSSLVAQYLAKKNLSVVALDIDPINATLHGYKGLNVRRLDVVKNNVVDEEKFDEMIDQIIQEDTNFVVDNGASSFVALSSYMIDNDIINVINESNKQVYIHTVIKAGQDLLPTLKGFDALAKFMPESVKIVVWLNSFGGEILTPEGKPFEETKAYKRNKDRVHAIVRLEHEAGTSHSRDMRKMLGSWLTFDEAENSTEFTLMAKKRLAQIRESIFSQLEQAIQ